MTSKHYTNDRQEREKLIRSIGKGHIIDSFIVDRGHRNGPEIHKITSTGIIEIYNKRTYKLITKLIANPYQIERYYINKKAPKNLIKIAMLHAKLGYNYI